MRRGLLNLAAFTFLIGIAAIYLGLGIVRTGQEFPDSGDMFGTEMSVLGGLWSFLGLVLAFLGILCIPAGLGIATLREWGRKNGAVILFLISAICILAGFIVAYTDIIESIIYFVLTVLAIICAQLLRERRTLFELGLRTGERHETMPTYRETKHVRNKVVMRRGRGAPGGGRTRTVNCPRCGTVNVQGKTHCMKCGGEL